MEIRVGLYHVILAVTALFSVIAAHPSIAQEDPSEPVSAASEDQTVVIGKIKIQINDVLYVWEAGSPVPERAPGGFTAPVTVISYLGLKPGDTLRESSLERKAFLADIRLRKSTFFYDSSVLVAPSTSDLQKRNMFITVTEGFLYRFGGGDSYGMIGRDNIGGKRKSFRAFIGYNLIGGEYRDSLVGDTNTIIGAKGYFTRSDRDLKNLIMYTAYDATLFGGYRFTPDISTIFSLRRRMLHITKLSQAAGATEREGHSNRTYLSAEANDSSHFQSLWGILDYSLTLTGDAITYENHHSPDATRYKGVLVLHQGNDDISLNIQLSSGTSSSEIRFTDLFDLYTTPDQSVRSGYASSELISPHYAMANTELRFGLFDAIVPPMFPVKTQGFLFADFAYTSPRRGDLFSDPVKDAYGIGARVLFENPVFAYFTFTYGTNRFRERRFIFTGSAGF
jgi:hypothetical protein